MKRIVALVLAIMLMAGCSTKKEDLPVVPAEESAINVQLGGEPQTLDPAFVAQPDEASYLGHLLEGLTVLGDKLEPMPGVASSWERTQDAATGRITYTFQLNPEAKWSDGKAVTAGDFIYSWTRTLNPATKSPVAHKLYPIRGARDIQENGAGLTSLGVSTTEAGELTVELEGECPDLLVRMATSVWMPLRESMVKENPANWFHKASTYLTNGPYVMTEWARDQSILMEKSKSYHKKDAVKAPKLNFVLMEDEEALMAALREGTLQYAVNLPLMELESAAGSREASVQLGTYALAFNTANKPFDNAQLRQALSLALDRTQLAAVMRDQSVPATGLIPPGAVVEEIDFRKKAEKLTDKDANITKAQKLLKEAGHTDGKGVPTINYLIDDGEAHRRVAEAVAGMWQPLGISVEITSVPWKDYLGLREDGKFDVTRFAVFSDDLYPSVFLEGWLSDSEVNFAHYSSNAYDGLLDQSYGRVPRQRSDAPGVSGTEAAAGVSDAKAAPGVSDAKAAPGVSDAKAAPGVSSAAPGASDVPPSKAPVDYLIEAEALLVGEDAVVVPLTWYTSEYMAAEGMKGFSSFPNGTVYFGKSSYTKPEKKK